MPEEMMCMAESAFIAIIVTVSMLCVLFSGVIVAWGCSRLRSKSSPTYADHQPPSRIFPVIGAI